MRYVYPIAIALLVVIPALYFVTHVFGAIAHVLGG